MSKRRRTWNQATYERYLKEGQGCGSGADYKPWIRVQDFASQGMVSRVKGRTTGRVHHLLSNNELAYFYLLDWSDSITDIREQYPLSDLDCVIAVAAQAGIKYPTDNISGYPYIMTCDFMIATTSGAKARTIKMTKELENPRTLEKLEIERRYWAIQGVDWRIVTEHEISRQKAKNIEWLYTSNGFSVAGLNEYELEHICFALLALLNLGDYSIVDAVALVECEFMLPAGTGLQLFKRLAYEKKIAVDLSRPINLNVKGVAA